MLKLDMARCSTVLGCCAAALLLASCGGGSKTTNSGTATTGSALSTGGLAGSNTELAQTCGFVREAATLYHSDANAVRLNLKDKAALRRVIVSAGQLRERLHGLEQKVGGQAASELNAYSAALAQQEIVINAIINNDFKTAAAHSQNLNQELEKGKLDLARICSGF